MSDGKSFLVYIFLSYFHLKRTSEPDSNNSSHHLPAILASTEAAKDFAHHAQQVLFKTPRASRHAKSVQSTRIFLKKASRQKLTA